MASIFTTTVMVSEGLKHGSKASFLPIHDLHLVNSDVSKLPLEELRLPRARRHQVIKQRSTKT